MAISGKPYGINPATGLMEPLTNISGLSNIYFVRVATTANLTATYSSGSKTLTNSGANAALSIDGVTLSAADKVLVKNQSTGSQNGLYTVTTVGDGSTPWVLTRSTDMDTATEAEERDWFWITEGTVNADNGYALSTPGTITLDTTTLTFTRMLGSSAGGSYQPLDAALTDVADVGVVSAANKFHYSTAQGVWAEGTVTQSARAIMGLNWSAGTQVPAVTAAGTASLLTVGVGAGNVLVLDGNAGIDGGVALFPPDSWDYTWEAANGSPTSNGWTQTGGQPMTVASTTYNGVACYSLTPSSNSGTSYISKATGVAAANSFEIWLKVAFPLTSGTAPRLGVLYNPNATSANSKRFEFGITSTGPSYWNSTTTTSLGGTTGDLSGQWMDIRWKIFKHAINDVGGYVIQTSIGALVTSTTQVGSLGAISGSAGDLALGRFNAGTHAGVIYIAGVYIKNGLNSAPVSYTFRNNTWPL